MAKRIEVTVPDIGDFSGIPVIELLVDPGDRVEFDDPLLTLESDKATMDIPAPAAGVVAEFRVELGDEVSEGDVLLVLESAAADEERAEDSSPAAPAAERTEESLPAAPDEERTEDSSPAAPTAEAEDGTPAEIPASESGAVSDEAAAEPAEAPEGAAPPEEPSALPIEPGAPEAGWGHGDPRAPGTLRRPPPTAKLPSFPGRRTAVFHATPSVRRFARELGADLPQVTGTGRKGRILEEDVRRHVKERLTGPAAPAPAAGGAGAAVTGLPPLPAIDFSKFGETEEMPLSRIKRRTAANLARAWLTVPLVTHFDETDVTDLEAFRRSLRDDPEARGARITLLAFAMKALVATLKAFPTFNASLAPDGESLVLKRYFHLGIAVDTPEGLVVPVVRDVDRKRVTDLSLELAEVSERARGRKLRPDDVQGSCMTISSLGGIGGTGFTPIVNPPEVAILGLARTRVAPVWNGREFEPRTVLPVSLSYDHRVIDGAEAARFSHHLCLVLGDVRRLLL